MPYINYLIINNLLKNRGYVGIDIDNVNYSEDSEKLTILTNKVDNLYYTLLNFLYMYTLQYSISITSISSSLNVETAFDAM